MARRRKRNKRKKVDQGEQSQLGGGDASSGPPNAQPQSQLDQGKPSSKRVWMGGGDASSSGPLNPQSQIVHQGKPSKKRMRLGGGDASSSGPPKHEKREPDKLLVNDPHRRSFTAAQAVQWCPDMLRDCSRMTFLTNNQLPRKFARFAVPSDMQQKWRQYLQDQHLRNQTIKVHKQHIKEMPEDQQVRFSKRKHHQARASVIHFACDHMLTLYMEVSKNLWRLVFYTDEVTNQAVGIGQFDDIENYDSFLDWVSSNVRETHPELYPSNVE
ncbi:hypothetical protein SELMODRAFT_424564 [Selaginella moellendorffii]|uniref:Uncharacterized protein n=1 Tax=Selaginella moellendorffii TaxID=88036 RepID=D8SQB5_SELML|nr:hypothetical protein SELMODRAFT_424564 [Selaginella moellendorffii]